MGGGLAIEEYIVVYCIPDIEMIRIQVPVNVISGLSIKVMVLVLERIEGLGIIKHHDLSCSTW